MKRASLVIFLAAAVLAGGVFWYKHRGNAPPPAATEEAKPAEAEAAAPRVTRDTNGNVVITISDELQGEMGIVVRNPVAARMNPELKGYGRVLDPAPLASLVNEMASAQAASIASSNELARLRTLEGQGNASTRALQTAEALALRDQLAVQSAADRLALAWGRPVANRKDLSALCQSLAALEAALVRIDLPAGEALSTPAGARIGTLSGGSAEAEFLGLAPGTDPQMQGRGFIFLCRPNSARIAPGEAVLGYLKVPGEPSNGVILPRDAVVRTEGAGWVYVMDSAGAEGFTRAKIALDHPTDTGWFVTNGITAGDYVVVNGAQQLLSIESRGEGGE